MTTNQTQPTSESLLESLEVALVVLDQQQIVQQVNLASEALFERSRSKLVGRNFHDLISAEQVQQCVQDCISDHARFTLREIPLPDRELLVDLSLSPIALEHAKQQSEDAGVLIEISSITRIAQFIKDKNQRERQQAFRLMMRSLAHEIKNPLGGIRGAAQLLHKELDDPEQQVLSNILIKEADRLTRLVDRVMGSRDQLKLEPLNIHEVLEHVANLLTVKSDNKHNQPQIKRQYDPALPEIMVDREQLIQAVLNIVGNAIEAQADAEQATVGFVTQFERSVTIHQKFYRQAIKVNIWDNGPGVPTDLRDTVFDPLITGRADGSGLGLSITQQIVQRHHGIVSLESHEGKTCFSILLPYTNAERADSSSPQG